MEIIEFKEKLAKEINRIRKVFKENEWCFRFSEATVRAEIIDPLLKTLGWELPYVKREFNNMDYMLCQEKLFQDPYKLLIIESKKYCEILREDNDKQLIGYCRNYGCYGILTNGIVWYLYDYDYRNEKPIQKVDLSDDKITSEDEICDFFFNISFEKFNPNNCLSIPVEDEEPQTVIWVDGEKFTSRGKGGHKRHCDANYTVLAKAYEKAEAMKCRIIDEPSPFYRKIKGEDRTNAYYDKDFSISGDYVIYDKIALLQEVNCALELGFDLKISAE